MTAASVEADVLSALDFDHEVPCELRTCEHGNPPARWIGTTHCGCRYFVCPGSKAATERYVTRMEGVSIHVRCSRCGGTYDGLAEGFLLGWEPLP